MDLAELQSFRLVYFKHKEIFLVVCIVSDGSSVLSKPVYRFSLIWSPAKRLVNRDRSDKGGPCRLHRAFSYTNNILIGSLDDYISLLIYFLIFQGTSQLSMSVV